MKRFSIDSDEGMRTVLVLQKKKKNLEILGRL